MAIFKAVQLAGQVRNAANAARGSGGGGGGGAGGGGGFKVIAGIVALFAPVLLVIVMIQSISSLIGFRDAANEDGCAATMAGAGVPTNYNFTLPKWDPDPAKRQQTKNPEATPGPLPETYEHAGKTVPYAQYFHDAERKFGVPWFFLAAQSWQETRHGADPSTWDRGANSDASYGPMQFIPATFRAYGVDGDNDGKVTDESVADGVFAAANLLVKNGFLEGPEGVLRAIGAYNPHEFYKNDVLFWAEKFSGGVTDTTNVDAQMCSGLDSGLLAQVVAYVVARVGYPYVWATEGPDSYDCSGLMLAAYKSVGVQINRRAVDQADDERIDIVKRRPVTDGSGLMPGDLLFMDNGSRAQNDYSSRLQAYIGHVAMYIGNGEVVEAYSSDRGVIRSKYEPGRWAKVMGVGRVKGMVASGGSAGPWARPVTGVVTSEFGLRASPGDGGSTNHKGIDIGAGCGTPIYAVADGVVAFAGPANGYGNYIEINHGSNVMTGYGHEQALFVNKGDTVRKGQKIAEVGNLGNSTGCHLHFEVLNSSGALFTGHIDPKPVLIAHQVNYWG
ncbi:peptidoglycan DD-metalloendopeptidase family protein [Virgisporangium aliadipatigenens]|nr:peptidoglycan DD-metalloendopeptidase family protein [Virgisporangium aliadipatigenens]